MRRVAFATLGCKLNQAESGAIRSLLETSGGWCTVGEDDDADLVYVNTCTVTSQADAKGRQTIRRLAARHPRAALVAGGCYVQRAPGELAAIPGVRVLVGAADRERIVELAAGAVNGEVRHAISPIERARTFLEAPPSNALNRTRGFVRVQEGCGESCAFCVVPKTRGVSRSRSASGVLGEARALAAAGAREIVLTGANLGEWGADTFGRRALADLLREIVEIPGLLRVRLSSIDPDCVTPELLDLFASDRRIARHFHLPIQSGSEAVLAGMKRRASVRAFADLVREIDRRIPGSGIGSDVLAGFPGETDLEFERTFDLMTALPITYLHVFSYSVRPGSAAEALGDPVPADAKRRRTAALRRLSDEKGSAFAHRQVGRMATVLLERGERGGERHRTGYADNYLRVELGAGWAAGDVVRVRLLEATANGCRGELLEAA